MKAKLLGLTAALLFLADAPGQAQEILLGYLPSGAGPFATLSRTNEIAAQIAIDEINEAGGIAGKKMRIIAFDTAGKPDQAVGELDDFVVLHFDGRVEFAALDSHAGPLEQAACRQGDGAREAVTQAISPQAISRDICRSRRLKSKGTGCSLAPTHWGLASSKRCLVNWTSKVPEGPRTTPRSRPFS